MKTAEAHYARLADDYESNWAYSSDFIVAMSQAMATSCKLRSDDVVIDLGGGTGLYAREFVQLGRLRHPVYCVDPSRAMLDQVSPDGGVVAVRASAEQVASGPVQGIPDDVDVVIIKEAVHHFENPAAVIKGLAGRLRPGGRLLIVMLPVKIAYPLFEAALQRFSDLQPDPTEIMESMTAAGLATMHTGFEYRLTFPQRRYLDMVRNRYMSLLSTFSDGEITRGIEEIQRNYPGPMVSFVDRFEFLTGVLDG